MKKYFIVVIVFILLFAVSCTSTDGAIIDYMSNLSALTSLKDSEWTYNYYVDDFGNTTSEAYVRLKDGFVSGNFSNSATNYSTMYAKFLVNKSDIDIELFEYNLKSPVTLLSFEKASIKIQTIDGETFDLGTCAVHNGGKRLSIEGKSALRLFETLSTSETVKFRIVISGYGIPSVYNFSVDTTGFVNTYQEVFSEV